ncbi:MAG: hypothetical protein JW837_09595 [Sedimentisphaerales bacterium]|nr:hypothetical protein [Sedimentisphaerales bacterium]
MKIDTRKIESDNAVELFITASASPDIDLEKQANEVFVAIRRVLESHKSVILQERFFGTREALRVAHSVRNSVYGDLDDGVEPAWLVVPEGINGQLAGVQVHALSSEAKPEILLSGKTPCGRIVPFGDSKYLTISGIQDSKTKQATAQARVILEKAEVVLKQAGADMHSVPRTWMWLGNILSWYDDFNKIRNEFFVERGLIGKGTANKMPASTGIGIGPQSENGAICGMDLVAVIGPNKSIGYFDALGKQDSALKYGSAFSRACSVETPAGITLFVSGTASIDINGKTINTGNVTKQIETTISNVRAVLHEMQFDDDNMVQAIAYCKTAEIEKFFWSKYSDLAWPNLTVIADVCRDDLLFEIEATAAISK